MMERCRRCLMPDTRPGSEFIEGVCGACRNYDQRAEIDWLSRQRALRTRLEGKHVLVAVSGGKDSHWIVKTVMDLGATVDTFCVHDIFTPSKAGVHNLNNLRRLVNGEHYDWYPNRAEFTKNTRYDFEKTGEAFKWIEIQIYSRPATHAAHYHYDECVFGEDSSIEYGGENTIGKIHVLYMSHFYPWDDIEHYHVAKGMGFKSLDDYDDWPRMYWPESFSQLDSIGYPVHLWLKYPKFGFQRVTDVASRRVRAGYWTKEFARELIDKNDHMLDPMALQDFCQQLGYSRTEFWNIVENAGWNKYFKGGG